MKKSKQITITDTDNNVEYTLEYNREALAQMESWGFNYNDFLSKPATSLPLVFRGAFYKNHAKAKISDIDRMFDKLQNREELIPILSDMMSDCYQSLINGDGEEKEKNVTWKIVE